MKTSRTAGYSGTPLFKKLGIVAGSKLWLSDAPDGYRQWVAPLPAGVVFEAKASVSTDIAHVFVHKAAELAGHLAVLRKTLKSDAALWVSWPKKSSKVTTDITEDTIREMALPLGFVDIKVCAVSEVWSGLKLVVRKELR